MSQPQTTPRSGARTPRRWSPAAAGRATLTFLIVLIVETLVCGAAATPSAVLLMVLADRVHSSLPRGVLLAFSVMPAYVLFALCLMPVSAASTWLTGARTPPDREMRIADMGWPLMRWARYMAASHVVRLLAGALFRGTPIWTMYMRMNGARLGRRVFVNSLFVSDHNLLDFGDDVVIGAEVHLSGHTVERGMVRTGRVCLGHGVTIGQCSVVDIDVAAGDRAQVGALTLVPKHARLEPGVVYVGIPARPLDARGATLDPPVPVSQSTGI